MVSGIGPERVNEHVDVGKDQRPAIRSSSSLDRFRSTPGRVPPDAFEIGKCTRECWARCGSARIILSPSSISEVNVCPFSAAFFLALRSRSSESRIVVLMHQSIQCRHIYVKPTSPPCLPWGPPQGAASRVTLALHRCREALCGRLRNLIGKCCGACIRWHSNASARGFLPRSAASRVMARRVTMRATSKSSGLSNKVMGR